MTLQVPMINSRQKELLQKLLYTKKPVSYQELADSFKLSKRTIQREISDLKSFLDYYKLKIGRKIGSGIELKGSMEGIEQLKEELGQAQAFSVFSTEERQQGMIYSLLLSKEPIKQFVFSQKYAVSEATISSDLDKVGIWLKEGGLQLKRTPGVGVYVEGSEMDRRTTLSRLLHKDITFEEWLELFHLSSSDTNKFSNQVQLDIRNQFFKFVDTSNLFLVEQTVRRVLKKHVHLTLSDRNYVNLIVHIMLAVERLEHTDFSSDSIIHVQQLIAHDIYLIAEEIVNELEKVLSTDIPAVEVNYIALHLEGARISKVKNSLDGEEQFEWIELVHRYIRAVAHHLEKPLDGDEMLMEGLVAHFVPAFNRMKLQLQIHNPMLEEIKTKYSDVFRACKKASLFLSEKIGCEIPDDEIGYIAMHIGASLVRQKNILHQSINTIVVCASGLGTSTYLASRLQNEIPNLNIKAVISLNELEQWLKINGTVDILISTVCFSFNQIKHHVIVSPFLTKDDVKTIQMELLKVNIEEKNKLEDRESDAAASIFGLAKYGEAMVQIERNLSLFEHVQMKQPVVVNLVQNLSNSDHLINSKLLIYDLEKREQQGSFVIDDLAMLHAKSSGVSELFVGIFRLVEAVVWKNDHDQDTKVQTILLLAAPETAPREHIEMISEISAALIEDQFIENLKTAPFNQMKNMIELLLVDAYKMKAKSTLKG